MWVGLPDPVNQLWAVRANCRCDEWTAGSDRLDRIIRLITTKVKVYWHFILVTCLHQEVFLLLLKSIKMSKTSKKNLNCKCNNPIGVSILARSAISKILCTNRCAIILILWFIQRLFCVFLYPDMCFIALC